MLRECARFIVVIWQKKSMNTREIIEWNECVWWEHERVLTALKDGEEIYGLCALELTNLFI